MTSLSDAPERMGRQGAGFIEIIRPNKNDQSTHVSIRNQLTGQKSAPYRKYHGGSTKATQALSLTQ